MPDVEKLTRRPMLPDVAVGVDGAARAALPEAAEDPVPARVRLAVKLEDAVDVPGRDRPAFHRGRELVAHAVVVVGGDDRAGAVRVGPLGHLALSGFVLGAHRRGHWETLQGPCRP